NPQYRGVKKYGGQSVTAGSILVRQLATVIRPTKDAKSPRRCTTQGRAGRHREDRCSLPGERPSRGRIPTPIC
ncbi:50S ribosomal protein L27, partial [Bremerella sp. JC817]|uniref:50S ribosomal protein L27 n=1 Tax=Bremerella sp. JC817 TaxID=3231756 RepID=UPI00345945CA